MTESAKTVGLAAMATNQAVTTLNVSLPESMRSFVDAQVSRGGYTSASEYMRELIREAQKKAAQKALEARLLKNLRSGQPIKLSEDYWNTKFGRVRERAKKTKRR